MTGTCGNVAEYLLHVKCGARPALWLLDGICTYEDLSSISRRVARHLLSSGGKKGDRVVLIAENSVFWVGAYLGTLLAGMVSVPLPTGITRPELEDVLASTEARFGFVQHRMLARYAAALDRLLLVTDSSGPGGRDVLDLASLPEWTTSRGFAEPLAAGDDLAVLMYTSGSTGTPRAVMVSHRNIMANTDSIIEYLRLTEVDRMMTVLPFHYCFGMSLLHTHLRAGGSLVIDSRFRYPEEVLKRMIETECTGFAGVPSHYNVLLRSTDFRKKQFPKLRHVQQAGGRLAELRLRELQAALPNTDIFVMYGQTEATARLSYLPPQYLEWKLGSIGKGIPGVKLSVVDESGREVEPNQVGEIVAEGENIAHGYWRAPEETATYFRDGRLYTGDLATVDKDGFIYVLDRAKEFLKCAGKRVSCRTIEDRLLQHHALIEAAVIGIADEVTGEAVKAFVVPSDPSPAELERDLMTFCRKNLAVELVPKEIVILDALPKNSAGKVLKRELRNLGPILEQIKSD